MESDSACCTGMLTVTVVDSTATPIAGASVKLWSGGVVKEVLQTDASGKVIFDWLCQGEYGVAILKTGFQTREFDFAINTNCDPYSKTVELFP